MSTNISKLHREELLDKIRQIRTYIATAPQDANTGNLLQYLDELTKDVKGKKYGLVFEQHREKIDEKLETHVPVLTEDKNLFIDNGGEMNFLIEGDNLAALKLLEKTHKGKIDVIYIDPPYNTGNEDFFYEDDYVDVSDVFRHSKWLSFMEKRLKIAKNLLSKDGCILVSIDKNEGFQLKILLDEIFGEESMAADLHVETSVIAGPRRYAAVNGSVVKTAEFVLGYTRGDSKKIIKSPTYDYIPGFDTHYSLFFDQSQQKFVKFVDYLKSNDIVKTAFKKQSLTISLKNLGKLIQIEDEIKKWLYSDEISRNLFRESDPDNSSVPEALRSKSRENSLLEYNGVVYRIDDNKNANVLFRYSDRIGPCDDYFQNYGERSIRGNLWKGFSADGGNLAKEGGVSFKNGKKPKRLIKQLVKTVSGRTVKKEYTVLDFFAGSGTTGESVLELNTEDGLKRKFILCTNNENNICLDKTYKRMENVINRYNYPASLKYYKIDFVPINDKFYYEYADDLLKHVRELVELENGINFNGNSEIAIVLNDYEMDKFISLPNNNTKILYRGHDVLLTDVQEDFLKTHHIKVNVIPNYYYNELNK
jgi:adenine-specific DNA-methyltransferase